MCSVCALCVSSALVFLSQKLVCFFKKGKSPGLKIRQSLVEREEHRVGAKNKPDKWKISAEEHEKTKPVDDNVKSGGYFGPLESP